MRLLPLTLQRRQFIAAPPAGGQTDGLSKFLMPPIAIFQTLVLRLLHSSQNYNSQEVTSTQFKNWSTIQAKWKRHSRPLKFNLRLVKLLEYETILVYTQSKRHAMGILKIILKTKFVKQHIIMILDPDRGKEKPNP